MERDVVITGLGVVTGLGVGIDALWAGLVEGRSALRPIKGFDASGFPCRLGAEVENFRAKDFVPKSYRKAVKVMARDIELAVGAASCAVRDAGLTTKGSAENGEDPTYAPEQIGCQIGAGLIACDAVELTMAEATATDERGDFDLGRWGEEGMYNLTPLWLLKYLPNMLACHVTIIHAAKGPSNTITCSEASGLLSIGESRRVIERSDAEMCFSGGAETKISPIGLVRMHFAKRTADTGDEADGSRVVRPYDPEAPGSLLGEGGGIVILESAEAARSRGATVYARVAGFGAAQTRSSGKPGAGLAAAARTALADAGLSPEDVDVIVPHGAGERGIDGDEAAGLREVFGGRLSEVPLLTTAPNIGDTMAGAGGVAACVAAKALKEQRLPARLHAGTPADGLRAGREGAADAPLRAALVCTNAMGGQNAALVLKAV